MTQFRAAYRVNIGAGHMTPWFWLREEGTANSAVFGTKFPTREEAQTRLAEIKATTGYAQFETKIVPILRRVR